MRRVLLLCLIALSFAGAADAASLDPSRIAAIDQAADAFLARARETGKGGMVPRQSNPGVAPLLDTVFDTSDLSHGSMPLTDLDKLDDWLTRIVAVGRIYLSAGKSAHDLGVFGPEIGRFADASVAILRAISDCVAAEIDAHPDAKPSPADQRKLAQLRGTTGETFGEMIDLLRTPGLSVGWVQLRLTALREAAPSIARFLTPDEIARLRAIAIRLAAAVKDRPLRAMFGDLATALATPSPPTSIPAVAGGAEIALENDGQGYSVPVRINGVLTVKFVVDSGASVVVLPSDLVETLTKNGSIAPGDTLGRNVYVTADGRKHHGTRLLLRELTVGGHTVTNVMASVAPAHAEPLLGQSFLAKFKSWTLDNRRHVLVIAE